MTTKAEAVLTSLFAAIAAIPSITAARNEALPKEVPPGGLIILDDGDAGEPEVTLSPLIYNFEHVAEANIFVKSGDNDAAFDALKAALGLVIASDRTLGGLCDWIEAGAPVPDDVPFAGTHSIKAGIVPIRLFYSTSDPLA